jgi:hypothetical protein
MIARVFFVLLLLCLTRAAWAALPEAQPEIVQVETFRVDKAGNRVLAGKSLGFIFESDGHLLTAYSNLTSPVTGDMLMTSKSS